jgi:3D (Asp-Asp-Asp) domain-containing protein
MYVPGYGWGVVQDTGGDFIGKSNRTDVWFPSSDAAFKWGRKAVTVTVCRGK